MPGGAGSGIQKAEEAISFTNSRFGVEIKATDFALYKGKQKHAGAPPLKAKPGRKLKAAQPAIDAYVAATPRTGSNVEADLIESLEALKPLIASMGAEKIKRLVDLLG